MINMIETFIFLIPLQTVQKKEEQRSIKPLHKSQLSPRAIESHLFSVHTSQSASLFIHGLIKILVQFPHTSPVRPLIYGSGRHETPPSSANLFTLTVTPTNIEDLNLGSERKEDATNEHKNQT